jgi:hypothetical protein
MRLYVAKYYSGTDEQRLKRTAATRKSRYENRYRILQYLRQHPCVDCGEPDVLVLEFDHVRGEKVGEVLRLVNRGARWERVEAEIAKCDVRCANCHRRKTLRNCKYTFRLSN